MSQIAVNITGLNISQKLDKGQTLITKGTNNPLVPGNGPALTAFSTVQTALNHANANVLNLRESLRLAILQRNEAETAWDGGCTGLADFTQTATSGSAEGIVSAGFDVRSANSAPQPLSAPENLKVNTNGSPGVSKLRWKPVAGAVNYFIECSPTTSPNAQWVQVGTSTKSFTEIPGATPGQECWFRVRATGPLGDGPWCTPVQRPVM